MRRTTSRFRTCPTVRDAAVRARLEDGTRGASSIEFALYTPVLFFVIFAIVQFGLSWHANQVASATAREAARVARTEGGALDLAETHGEQYAEQVGGNALQGVDVTVEAVGTDQVRATVTGQAMEIIDGLAPEVQQEVQGPIEEFRPDL